MQSPQYPVGHNSIVTLTLAAGENFALSGMITPVLEDILVAIGRIHGRTLMMEVERK